MISDDKTKKMIYIPKELCEQAEKIAAKEDRSFSSYVVQLIRKDVETNKEKP